MTRTEYYKAMRELALIKRAKYSIETQSLNLQVVRQVYGKEGIKIDIWDTSPRIRAAYFCDDGNHSVLVNKNLPREPRLFSMIHELKHHYEDQEIITDGKIQCGDYNANEMIEIGAEVFAAEFIYPEEEMKRLIDEMNINSHNCTPCKVVEFKKNSPALVSYSFLSKRFEWFGLCKQGEYQQVKFNKLEEEVYGVPIYKQEWFKRNRSLKKMRPKGV